MIFEILATVAAVLLAASAASIGYKVRKARKELFDTMPGWENLDLKDQRQMLITYLLTDRDTLL